MLRMDQVHIIRHKVLIEGRSQRSVALELGVSRNTVRKYQELSEPRRVESAPRRCMVRERVAPRLAELLEDWSKRTTRKQRLTGTRLHRQLVEEGLEVGITTVRSYFREWKRQRQEAYIPLMHHPGEEAQVDFFEVTVEEERHRASSMEVCAASSVFGSLIRVALGPGRPGVVSGWSRPCLRALRWGP